MGSQKISFHITLCMQPSLELRENFCNSFSSGNFRFGTKMIMSHQADLVDGCGAGGRPSDYLSSSLSKGTSQCEPHTHNEMLRF